MIAGIGFIIALTGCEPSEQKAAPDGQQEEQAKANVIEAMNRGVALMGQYQYGQAVAAFREALAAEPGLLQAKLNLAISMFNRNSKEEQDLDNGMRLLNELVAQDPANVRARYFKGIVLQHVGNTTPFD